MSVVTDALEEEELVVVLRWLLESLNGRRHAPVYDRKRKIRRKIRKNNKKKKKKKEKKEKIRKKKKIIIN